MNILFYLFKTFLFLYSLDLTKEEICGAGQISVSGLGQCEDIRDVLEKKDLKLNTRNLLYLASNNEGKIEKDGYKLEIFKLTDTKLQSHNMKKSKLYIPNSCMEKMEKKPELSLDKSQGIVIIVYDSNNLNDNNITDNYFIIRHNSDNAITNYISSKEYDFSFCHEDPILFDDEIKIEYLKYANDKNKPIDVDKILYGKKYGIDLFDRDSTFLSDICFKFKSEKGSDVTLESRVEDYFQNITFCDDKENSHYMSYSISAKSNTISYRCAFGYYTSEANKASYLDKIDKELKSLVAVSNVKVINCYKKFLNLRDVIRNYGGMICIFVLIIQIVCFLIFCFSGTKYIEEQLDDLFILGKVIIRRFSMLNGNTLGISGDDGLFNIGKKLGKKINLWGQIKKLRERRLLKEQKEQKEKQGKSKRRKSKSKSNPPGKNKRRSSISKYKGEDVESNKEKEEVQLNIVDIKNEEVNNDITVHNSEKDKTNKNMNIKEEAQNNNLAIKIKSSESSGKTKTSDKNLQQPVTIYDQDKNKNVTKNQNGEKISEHSQLYDYENDELNDMPLKKALEEDKRTFCQYYGNILLFSHIILNVFFMLNDYNLFVVKLGLLFMTFPINLTMNIFFFTNKNIELNYVRSLDDISKFWGNIANTVYSSILSMTLLIILKLICLTHNSVRTLRKNKNVNQAQKQSECVLKCIKVRITIYFILSFAFLTIFGYYVLCFCAIFENTQIDLIKSTFTSWLISLIYPFIICFITSIMRSLAFSCKSKVLYTIKTIMQFL